MMKIFVVAAAFVGTSSAASYCAWSEPNDLDLKEGCVTPDYVRTEVGDDNYYACGELTQDGKANCEAISYTDPQGISQNCVYKHWVDDYGFCRTKHMADYFETDEGAESHDCEEYYFEDECGYDQFRKKERKHCAWVEIGYHVRGSLHHDDDEPGACIGRKLAARINECAKYSSKESCAAATPPPTVQPTEKPTVVFPNKPTEKPIPLPTLDVDCAWSHGDSFLKMDAGVCVIPDMTAAKTTESLTCMALPSSSAEDDDYQREMRCMNTTYTGDRGRTENCMWYVNGLNSERKSCLSPSLHAYYSTEQGSAQWFCERAAGDEYECELHDECVWDPTLDSNLKCQGREHLMHARQCANYTNPADCSSGSALEASLVLIAALASSFFL